MSVLDHAEKCVPLAAKSKAQFQGSANRELKTLGAWHFASSVWGIGRRERGFDWFGQLRVDPLLPNFPVWACVALAW